MEFLERHKRRLTTFIYNERVVISGSSSEIPAAYFFANPTDIDFMIYRVNVCAVPRNAQPPNSFRGEVLTIDPDGLPVGYVRMKNAKQEFEKQLLTFEYDNPHGPAITSALGLSALAFDNVYSVQCPYWPSEAHEWQTRHRSHGWPSKDLIDEIVKEGCFLVGKSCPGLADDDKTHWRYSFSKAEVKLISSWTDSQMYVYHVLRMIKSEIVKEGDDKKMTGICTYHFKTQMLWACEEEPAEFWEDSNLVTSICKLLTQMLQRLVDRNLPNYFIRDCNIVDSNVCVESYREKLRLLNTELGRSILKSKLPPKVCQECRATVSLPLQMVLYGCLFADRFGIPYQAHRQNLEKLKALIDEELDDLINGIYNMQLAKTQGVSYYAVAEQYLWNATACPSTGVDNVGVKRIKLSLPISPNYVKASYESLENAEISTLVGGNNKWDVSVVNACTKNQCLYGGMTKDFHWDDVYASFNEKWLNPSHLLSAAYLSNLYFITENFLMCRELVIVKCQSASNAFNTELYPMIFCPELASLFDENLQEVLGMLWLCKHILGRKENFECCTCPQLFMLYIRIKASFRVFDMYLSIQAVNRFLSHRDNCKFRFHLHSYHYVLLEMAWRICKERLQLMQWYAASVTIDNDEQDERPMIDECERFLKACPPCRAAESQQCIML